MQLIWFFIIKLLSQHISCIIMPIFRRTRPCTTAYGVLHTAYDPTAHNHSQHNQRRTPYVVVRGLVLLMMDIMMPETCWDRSMIINIRLVASCWFLSVHPKPLFHWPIQCEFHELESSRQTAWGNEVCCYLEITFRRQRARLQHRLNCGYLSTAS